MEEREVEDNDNESEHSENDFESEEVICDIRIATDEEDLINFQEEGYELTCTRLSSAGIEENNSQHLWKFHVLVKYGPYYEGGIEDFMWLTCPKSVGTLPSVDKYKVYYDFDLSDDSSESSLFIAIKYGANPCFNSLSMFISDFDHDSEMNEYFKLNNLLFIKSTAEVCRLMNGVVGVVLKSLIPLNFNKNDENNNDNEENEEKEIDLNYLQNKFGHDQKNNNFNNLEQHSSYSSNDQKNEINLEGETIASLREKIFHLTNEREKLINEHNIYEMKCIELIMRENDTKTHITGTRKSSLINSIDVNSLLSPEMQAEKQSFYLQMMDNIHEKKLKLEQQKCDFDQLTLDLQTRLDDKENKAKASFETFHNMKNQTLSGALNSKTNKNFTKKEIAELDKVVAKKYENLENVRIKNISLKFKLRKLERTLRHKEQLAEGLHVIDFEQLKIENQSLHEKIQERDEELMKLKRKKTSSIQVLTHIREKLCFLEKSNENNRKEVLDIEERVQRMRLLLSSVRQDRDELSQEKRDIQTKQQFAKSSLLIKDYDDRINDIHEAQNQLNDLRLTIQTLKPKNVSNKSKTMLSAN